MPVNRRYGLRSTRVGNSDEATNPQESEIERSKLLHCNNLRAFLDRNNFTHLLKNIYEVDELEFFDAELSPDYLPKKLHIGKIHNDVDIYARVQNTCGIHVVHYWSANSAGTALQRITLRHQDIGQQIIIHPFNKTYPTDSHFLTTADLERIDVLVTWYFIASGIATTTDTPSYRERLIATLFYIANRMGPAAAKHPPPPEVIHQCQVQSSDNEQDIALTKVINCIDEELEQLEISMDNCVDHWAKERARISETNGVDEARNLLEIEKQIFTEMWVMKVACILRERAIIVAEREVVMQTKRSRRNNDITRRGQGLEMISTELYV
jgi:hypothetical protein